MKQILAILTARLTAPLAVSHATILSTSNHF